MVTLLALLINKYFILVYLIIVNYKLYDQNILNYFVICIKKNIDNTKVRCDSVISFKRPDIYYSPWFTAPRQIPSSLYRYSWYNIYINCLILFVIGQKYFKYLKSWFVVIANTVFPRQRNLS